MVLPLGPYADAGKATVAAAAARAATTSVPLAIARSEMRIELGATARERPLLIVKSVGRLRLKQKSRDDRLKLSSRGDTFDVR